jgi:short-subunit dehydrogenase
MLPISKTNSFPYRQALVTGASRGLGRAFALALLAAGVEVWGTSRDGTRLPEGVRALALDLGDPDSIARLVSRLRDEAPELDLLVNNAGGGTWCPFDEFPADELERQWRVLLAAPVSLCRAFYPLFAERKHGAIVNVASLAGQFPIPFMSTYSAAKAGLSAFSRTLMLEATGSGVAVVDFQPGDYATGFNDNMHRPHRERSASSRETRAWDCCEEHLHAGPPPEHAARALLRALRKGGSRTVATGTFFQARLGPLLARVLPASIVRWYLRGYYALSNSIRY